MKNKLLQIFTHFWTVTTIFSVLFVYQPQTVFAETDNPVEVSTDTSPYDIDCQSNMDDPKQKKLCDALDQSSMPAEKDMEAAMNAVMLALITITALYMNPKITTVGKQAPKFPTKIGVGTVWIFRLAAVVYLYGEIMALFGYKNVEKEIENYKAQVFTDDEGKKSLSKQNEFILQVKALLVAQKKEAEKKKKISEYANIGYTTIAGVELAFVLAMIILSTTIAADEVANCTAGTSELSTACSGVQGVGEAVAATKEVKQAATDGGKCLSEEAATASVKEIIVQAGKAALNLIVGPIGKLIAKLVGKTATSSTTEEATQCLTSTATERAKATLEKLAFNASHDTLLTCTESVVGNVAGCVAELPVLIAACKAYLAVEEEDGCKCTLKNAKAISDVLAAASEYSEVAGGGNQQSMDNADKKNKDKTSNKKLNELCAGEFLYAIIRKDIEAKQKETKSGIVDKVKGFFGNNSLQPLPDAGDNSLFKYTIPFEFQRINRRFKIIALTGQAEDWVAYDSEALFKETYRSITDKINDLIFANGGLLMASAHAETTDSVDTEENAKIASGFLSDPQTLMKSIGIAGGAATWLLGKNIAKKISEFLAGRMVTRAVFYTGAHVMASRNVKNLDATIKELDKKIKQAEEIEQAMAKGNGTGGFTSEKSTGTTSRKFIPLALSNISSLNTEKGPCLKGSKLDYSCKCRASNSCKSTVIPNSQFVNMNIPGVSDYASSLGGVTSAMANGNLTSAKLSGAINGSANQASKIKLKKISDAIDKVLSKNGHAPLGLMSSGEKFPDGFKKALIKGIGSKGIADMMKGSTFGSMKGGDGNSSSQGQGNQPVKVNIDLSKFQGGGGGAKSSGGGDFNLGLGDDTTGLDTGISDDSLLAKQADELSNYELDHNDISKRKEDSIFKILTTRYLLSYPRVLEESKRQK